MCQTLPLELACISGSLGILLSFYQNKVIYVSLVNSKLISCTFMLFISTILNSHIDSSLIVQHLSQ